MDLYFAYGSNLDPAQMMRRCPDSVPLAPAILPQHRLAFAGRSGNWEGGVALVVPTDGIHVPGFLYEVSEADLEELDRFEGTYQRGRAEVLLAGEATASWIYLRSPDIPRALPSHTYLAVMAHAYGRRGYDLQTLLSALDF